MCPQECESGRSIYKSSTQSPYQIWLARKVERAVERALQHEGQQILEQYVVSRKWVLPQICEERRLVTTKIHSLLLQWRPDFSAEWSFKLRRALPILEILFSHMASSKEDFSNPLLIEPRLKGVLSLLDSSFHSESPPLWPSSTHHGFASYLYCLHHPCHHPYSAEHVEAAEKACICMSCVHVDEERPLQNGQEARLCRSCLDVKGRQDVKGHEAGVSPNVDEKRFSEKTQKANSCLCESCWHLEERLDTKAQNASFFGSCLRVADELDEGNLDDLLEWSQANLPSRGTVATLMASELRSSRKEEANQALWNALASKEVALLKDNLHKHGEFASKHIVKKIMTMLKRSKKKEKHQKGKEVCSEQLLHAGAEEKNGCAELSTLKMRRSLSKGLFGLFSCHTAALEEGGLPADPTPLPTNLEALEPSHPCLLVSMHLKHVGGHAEKDDAIQAEVPVSGSSNMVSFSASSVEISTDDDNDDDSCLGINDHIKSKSLHYKPINETPVSLVSNSVIINGSEKLTWSSSTESVDRHSRRLSGDVLACHHNVEVDITAKTLSSGCACVDVQTDLVQSSLYDGNYVINSSPTVCSNHESDINSANEDFGQTNKYNPKGASMVSCSQHSNSESHGRLSVISHDDDHSRPSACSSITVEGEGRACLIVQRENDRSNTEQREGFMLEEAVTGVKGRREDPLIYSLNLEEAHRGPCKTSVDIIVDGPRNMTKLSSDTSIFPHINNDELKLAEANMPTESILKDGERREEVIATSSNVLQVNEDESQVAEASTEVGATQSRDEERHREERASGRRRARVPLISLLAEREDWGVQNIKSSYAWGVACPWDTWEEPNEALDPLCCVCMMGLKGAAFTPCGHTFCRKCSRELWKGRGTCPLCNKLITGILDIF